MRQLEHQVIRARTILRRTWARFARTDPEMSAPARFVIRLDDADLKGTLGAGEPLTPAQWHRAIAQVVEWLGPVPVTIRAQHAGDHPQLLDLVRFAHRLECVTELVTDGTSIDIDRARLLIDMGLARVRILVGGVSDSIQRAVVGNAGPEAVHAVQAFIDARADRQAALDIEVGIPWAGPVPTEFRAIVGWARQIGVDGVRVLAPFRAADMPADPELLDSVVDDAGMFCRNTQASLEEIHAMVAHQDGQPGTARSTSPARRRRMKCPVGGQRVVLTAHGTLYSCPFHPPIGVMGDELFETWRGAAPHLKAIASCNRSCAHVELAPEPIWG